MKTLALAAVAAVTVAGSANAAVITLAMIASNSPDEFMFSYQATLGPDEGLRVGDRFIIYDFGGYIDGSIFSASPQLTASVELTSPTGLLAPGFGDDAAIENLVFTYNGPVFRTSGGPLDPFDFNGLGARSTFRSTTSGSFFGLSTKNNPDGQPGGSGTAIFTLGSVAVPNAIPEPATWALMVGGFGGLGFAIRRRRRMIRVIA